MVALSTTEAEYIAAVEASKEMLWMRQFIVIALTFFALFSHPSPSFDPYNFTTLSLSLYPNDHSFIPFPLLPPFTRVKNKTKRPTAFI